MNSHLRVCKWLFEKGADIHKHDNKGGAPIIVACMQGNMEVCEWLLSKGADIGKADNYDHTPMLGACQRGHLSVCKWLVFHGALNRDAAGPSAAEEDASVGHVDKAIVQRGIRNSNHVHVPLLEWAQGVVAVHRAFRFAFLPGTLSTPTQRRGSAHLWMLSSQGAAFSRMFKELIAAFAWGGVESGRRLRNVREFAEVLEEELGWLVSPNYAEGAAKSWWG